MTKLYFHIAAYILLITIMLLIPVDGLLSYIVIIGATALFLAVLIWGSININSQFYIKTFCKGENNDKVAITFDDGPDENQTIEILNILDDYNIKATFFVVGNKAEEHTGLVKLIHDSGHLIGNHSYNHKLMFPFSSAKVVEKEVVLSKKIIENITGTTNKYFRPPFGITNPVIAHVLKKTGLKAIGWSIRTFDTTNFSKKKIIKRINNRLNGGDIILLHDTSKDIAALLKDIIEIINAKGYKAVKIDEL